MYYRPDNKSVAADVIPFYENGVYYLFYLKDYRDLAKQGEGCDWHLITTTDLVHYEDKGPVILRGTKDEQDLYVYTGSVFKNKDTYYIFYTGHNPYFGQQGKGAQKILLATSKDLFHWEKQKSFVFAPSQDYLEPDDFRDPFVFFDEEKKQFSMILTARYKSSPLLQCKGALLRADSPDLLHWKLEDNAFYAPDAFYAHECPDLFRIGKWWYLIFSEFTDRYVVTYRMATSLEGPWISPLNNAFDGHAFYAAKSATDGKRRILFGWNPTKERNDDNGFWQWGGTVVPHEIYQNEDGTLAVKCPHEVLDEYTKEVSLEPKLIQGRYSYEKNTFSLKGTEKRTFVALGAMKENLVLEMDVKPSSEAGDFGIYLNEKENFDYYYLIRFDALFHRLGFDKWPRYDRAKYAHVDVERPSSVSVGRFNHVTVIVQDTVLVVYVNNQIAMSSRMYEKGLNLGIFAYNVDVKVKNLTLRTIEHEKKE